MHRHFPQFPRIAAIAMALALSTPALAGDPIKRVDPVYPPDAARGGSQRGAGAYRAMLASSSSG